MYWVNKNEVGSPAGRRRHKITIARDEVPEQKELDEEKGFRCRVTVMEKKRNEWMLRAVWGYLNTVSYARCGGHEHVKMRQGSGY